MKSGGHKIKPDPVEGTKVHTAKGATAHRGKHGLAHKIGGNQVKAFKEGAREKFMRSPKQSEPDNVGRKTRPAAHSAKQAGVAKRARKTVKRLSDQVI